jgi:hypothetical protein
MEHVSFAAASNLFRARLTGYGRMPFYQASRIHASESEP